MDGADLVHGTLSLFVIGTYVPPLLFGHSRRLINHDHVHPTHPAFSRSPLRSAYLKEEQSIFPHVLSCMSSCVTSRVVCSMFLATPCPCALSHTVFLLFFPIMNPCYFAMRLAKD